MRKYHIYILHIVVCYMAGLMVSCNSSNDVHETEIYHISPTMDDSRYTVIKTSQYTIDSLCTLGFPEDITEMKPDKISTSDGRIYYLDTEITRMLYVFDGNGALINKIGERGRAKNEYVGYPDDFFVDSKGGLHVLDKLGEKIIVYDKNGIVENVMDISEYGSLHSFGLTGNDRYMMYYISGFLDREDEEQETPITLMMFDEAFKSYTPLAYSNDKLYYDGTGHSFFQDAERLSHIPIGSDSVYVYKNDVLEKIVHFDFGGKFFMKEHPDILKNSFEMTKATDNIFTNYKGVNNLTRYQETDQLIFLEYNYQGRVFNWLYNKKTKHAINGNCLFEGVNPYFYYFLRGNQIVAYIDTETVETLKGFMHNDGFKENLEKSPQQVKDLIEGKIKAPALFFMTMK